MESLIETIMNTIDCDYDDIVKDCYSMFEDGAAE